MKTNNHYFKISFYDFHEHRYSNKLASYTSYATASRNPAVFAVFFFFENGRARTNAPQNQIIIDCFRPPEFRVRSAGTSRQDGGGLLSVCVLYIVIMAVGRAHTCHCYPVRSPVRPPSSQPNTIKSERDAKSE